MQKKLISLGLTLGCVAGVAILNWLSTNLTTLGLPDWGIALGGILIKELLVEVEKFVPTATPQA